MRVEKQINNAAKKDAEHANKQSFHWAYTTTHSSTNKRSVHTPLSDGGNVSRRQSAGDVRIRQRGAKSYPSPVKQSVSRP